MFVLFCFVLGFVVVVLVFFVCLFVCFFLWWLFFFFFLLSLFLPIFILSGGKAIAYMCCADPGAHLPL